MKYFAEQVRAVRLDEFQFGKHKVFEVSYEKALELYWLHVMEVRIDGIANEKDVMALFERGQFVNIHKLGLLIQGKDISDSELFKQRLEGNIAKEVFK
jgi:hypothetical protein